MQTQIIEATTSCSEINCETHRCVSKVNSLLFDVTLQITNCPTDTLLQILEQQPAYKQIFLNKKIHEMFEESGDSTSSWARQKIWKFSAVSSLKLKYFCIISFMYIYSYMFCLY